MDTLAYLVPPLPLPPSNQPVLVLGHANGSDSKQRDSGLCCLRWRTPELIYRYGRFGYGTGVPAMPTDVLLSYLRITKKPNSVTRLYFYFEHGEN